MQDGESAATSRLRPRFTLRFLLIALTVLMVLSGFGLGAYRFFNPPDWVEVSVRHLLVTDSFVCVLAQKDGQTLPLPWYHKKVWPFTMNPGRDISSRPGGPREFRGSVKWSGAGRYGLLIYSEAGGWRVFWFEAREAPVRQSLPFFGGGRVAFDLAGRPSDPVSRDWVIRSGVAIYETR